MSHGHDLDRYALGAVLATGPDTVVRTATDTALERPVALKVATGPGAVARVAVQAGALARVDSPHVTTLHEADEVDGAPYVVTQLVAGGDVGALLRARGPLPPALAARVGAQVAEGLRDLHRAGVAHGAVEPAHVLIRDPDAPVPHAVLCSVGGREATPADDVVALGRLLRTLVGDRPPYDDLGRALEEVAARAVGGDADVETVRRRLADLVARGTSGDDAPTAAPSLPRAPTPTPTQAPTRAPAPAPARPAGPHRLLGRGRRRRLVAVAGALVVLAAAAVTGVVVLTRDDGAAPAAPTASPPVAGDLDGDGFGDVAFHRTRGLETDTVVLPSDGSSLGPPEVRTGPTSLVLSGDLDGDGVQDLVQLLGGDAGGFQVDLAAGGRRVADSAPFGEFVPKTADLDGDGRDDLLAISDFGEFPIEVDVALSAPDGTPGEFTTLGLPELDAGFLVPGDVDGDGADELVHVSPDRLSDGVLVATVLDDADGSGDYAATGPGTRFTADVQITGTGDLDGDGSDELVVRSATAEGFDEFLVLTGDGADGRPGLVEVPSWRTTTTLRTADLGLARFALVDVDGDGRTDVVQPTPDGDRFGVRVLRSRPGGLTDEGERGHWDCEGACEFVFTVSPAV